MSLLDVGLYVSGFWTLVYLIKTIYQRRNSVLNGGLLGQQPLTKSSSSDVQIQSFYLRLETRRLNDTQERLSSRITRFSRCKRILIMFYDLGSLSSLIGMFLAEGLLLWSMYTLTCSLLHVSTGPAVPTKLPTTSIYKRDWQDTSFNARNDVRSVANGGPPVALLVSTLSLHSFLFLPFRIHVPHFLYVDTRNHNTNVSFYSSLSHVVCRTKPT